MTIGKAGKQAQNFGQHRQHQYQLDYHQADTLPLTPPHRHHAPNREQLSSQHTQDESSTQQQTTNTILPTNVSESARYSDIQRSSTQEDTPAQAQTMSMQDTVQRDEVDVPESSNSGSGNDLIQEVAEQVFKLMLAEVKKDRERNGGRFR
jgi:hypothetical protein